MLIDREEDFESALSTLAQTSGPCVVDTETTGLRPFHGDRICGIGVRIGDVRRYFAFRHKEGPNLPESLIPAVWEQLKLPARTLRGHNIVFDLKMLEVEGMPRPLELRDSILGAHLMNENEESFKLEDLGTRLLRRDLHGAENKLLDLLRSRFKCHKHKEKEHLHKLPASDVVEYAIQDLNTTFDLHEFLQPHLERWSIDGLYAEICDYAMLVHNATTEGIPIDVELMLELSGQAVVEAEALQNELRAICGRPEFNPGSSKQVCGYLGIESSAEDVLEPMVHQGHEFASKLLKWRKWNKVNSTYYNVYQAAMTQHHRLHPNIKPHGTISGRPTCTDPNMFAIPRGTDEYRVKEVFRAPPGRLFVELDFSQAEVRVMAHYTQDPKLVEMILSGVNMHDFVAKNTGLPRQVAKRLNLSAQYGIGAPKFAKTYGYTVKEAREYLKEYHGMLPGMRRFYNLMDELARRKGYIRMFTGRLRHYNDHNAPTHKASSNKVQGDVWEMLRTSQQRIAKKLPEFVQLLPIYDSIVGTVPEQNALEIVREAKQIMEDQPWCKVPIKVDAKIGTHWGRAKSVE